MLKDGASALYGSEAVGGVVNIFTKDDFQGAELGFRYGTTLEGAVAERRGYAVAGVGNETTQITAGMQYYEIDPVFQRQRSYSSPEIALTTNFGGSVRDANSRYLIIGEDPLHFPGPIVANSPFNVGATPGSIAPGVGYAGIPQFYAPATLGKVLTFDTSQIPGNTLDTARTNVIASADHQIFGKQLEIFGNFLYSNSDYQAFLNAQPLNTNSGVIILGSVRVDPNTGNLVPENRGAPAPFNPFQQSLDAFSGAARSSFPHPIAIMRLIRVFLTTPTASIGSLAVFVRRLPLTGRLKRLATTANTTSHSSTRTSSMLSS